MAKFDNIVIVSDMDGTFFGKNSRIIPENVEAIEYFNKNGGKFTFITGRNYVAVINMYPELVKCITAPVAFHNGASIYDVHKNEVIFSHPLESKLASDMYRFLMSFYPELNTTLRCPDCFYSTYPEQFSDWSDKLKEFFHTTTYDNVENLTVDKIVFSGNEEKFPMMRELIKERYGGAVDCTSAGASSVELMPHGVNKGYAVQKLREIPELSGAKFFAIGDYENDIEMLTEADVSACPENALDEVKGLSDLHVCHHDKGAIAELIRIIEEKYIG